MLTSYFSKMPYAICQKNNNELMITMLTPAKPSSDPHLPANTGARTCTGPKTNITKTCFTSTENSIKK